MILIRKSNGNHLNIYIVIYIYTCIWKQCENAFYHSMIQNWEFGGVIAFPNMRRDLKLHISFNPIL